MNTGIYDHSILEQALGTRRASFPLTRQDIADSGAAGTLTFDDPAVAEAYDRGLVPALFWPWALRVVSERQDWDSLDVLDLAAGTGIVTEFLASAIGPDGSVASVDINPQMLERAQSRFRASDRRLTFRICPADRLEMESCSVDRVVCQQGFQFFPDKRAAAQELFRVLRPAGDVYLSTWLPVAAFKYFGALDRALAAVGRPDLASKMRAPFDYMPAELLRSCIRDAGFADVRVEVQALPLILRGGLDRAVRFAYSLPIARELRNMTDKEHIHFENALRIELQAIQTGPDEFGRMLTHVLRARKPVVRC